MSIKLNFQDEIDSIKAACEATIDITNSKEHI